MNDTETGLLHEALARLPFSLLWSHAIATALLLAAGVWILCPTPERVSAPFVGFGYSWEPKFFARLRFSSSASLMIQEGYSKWKDSMYKICRQDGDLVVLSRKYVDELKSLPAERLSAIDGLNFGGRYSGIDILSQSDIGTRAIQVRAPPDPKVLEAIAEAEADENHTQSEPSVGGNEKRARVCASERSPDAENHRPHHEPALRWATSLSRPRMVRSRLRPCAQRIVPPFIRPLLNLLLPTRWRYEAAIRRCQRLLVPEILRRRLQGSEGGYEKPDDLLQGIMDLSTDDNGAENVAQRQITITLVAGHSTAAAGSHALFDLVARPRYAEEIRAEAEAEAEAMGAEKYSSNKLWKLDSFLRECVRRYPAPRAPLMRNFSLLGFHRIVRDPAGITLHDGVQLPVGTHICVAPYSISSDADIVENPNDFDGLRYYRQRCEDPAHAMQHQHATADKSHMHFGYGPWSCPGRFMASDELKMILSTLLVRYEFRFPGGTSRPANGHVDEFPYVEPSTALLMRRRRDVDGS
ncbi:hypothetical protein DCS_01702 [Drechmeria coniospora]|uniref:Cytochrome P450 n=1 Tax=Drechmeria coniospora TaxID=98403 RepID=A0A151GTY1_DRECN|nr:hypothetical protein DCS_01702 [Drechmeria coniospora]KYK60565.1 hypothetical protein DCS_01702 [Drechmeria coniospora]